MLANWAGNVEFHAAGMRRPRTVPLGARPHWGKVSGMAPGDVRARYPRWDDFAALARSVDPAGKFANEYLDAYFPREA